MIKGNYRVERIGGGVAMDFVVKHHYLHRKCPCSMAFGLIDNTDKIKGVVVYGVPPSTTLLKGICGEEEKGNIYELNRLWVADDVPRNGESYLIGKSLKMIDKDIVVSFADTEQGHTGYIYQATNFLYCGLSAKFSDPVVKGYENMHHATYAHGMTNKEVVEKYGAENVEFVERPRKHRYIYIKGKRRKELLKKLRYTPMQYPKGNCVSEATKPHPLPKNVNVSIYDIM